MKIAIGRKTGRPISFDAQSHEKLLHAALRNRLTVPYECATGTCGSCRAKLVSGDLDDGWINAPGRKALKLDRGEFLLCQCAAISDCEIRIPSAVTEQASDTPAPKSFTGTIANFKKLTADVMSFSVSLKEEVGFYAGQFMLLQLPGVEGTRAYSMVNHSAQANKLDFVVKQLNGGKCSEWLFDRKPVETDITLFGPLGHAIFEPHLGHDLLLLAGGSGIAGMMAMLEHADEIDYLSRHSITLIFGVRTTEDIFYLSVLSEIAAKYPDTLQVTIALSESATNNLTSAMPDNLKIAEGFVHELIDPTQTDDNTMAFMAGPPPMVDASIRELIASCGFEVDRIRYDKFA